MTTIRADVSTIYTVQVIRDQTIALLSTSETLTEANKAIRKYKARNMWESEFLGRRTHHKFPGFRQCLKDIGIAEEEIDDAWMESAAEHQDNRIKIFLFEGKKVDGKWKTKKILDF